MEIHEGTLEGVKVITPAPIFDDRGFFMRVFSWDVHGAVGIDHTKLVQENQSRSRAGTIRGLHTRSHLSEAKLVRCTRGEVFDVVVDLRPWSSTFLRSEHFILEDSLHRQVYVPAGCAHGFQAVSEVADVCYRVDAAYDPALDVAIAYDDPDLAIPWPIRDPIVSARDRSSPRLADVRDQLTTWFGDARPSGLVAPL